MGQNRMGNKKLKLSPDEEYIKNKDWKREM